MPAGFQVVVGQRIRLHVDSLYICDAWHGAMCSISASSPLAKDCRYNPSQVPLEGQEEASPSIQLGESLDASLAGEALGTAVLGFN